MGKINVAELLSNCPKGMKLDCTIWGWNIEFDHINIINEDYPIVCRDKWPDGRYNIRTFTKYGYYSIFDSKCVIFPKGKTTWEGFVPPPPCQFKNGDVIFVVNNESGGDFQYEYIAIFKEIKRNKDLFVHGFYSDNDDIFSTHPYLCEITNSTRIKFATEEQKEKLFNLIKINGYEWNSKTNTFCDLVEPKF